MAVGLMATLTTTGMPLVMPPVRPPSLFVTVRTLPFSRQKGSLFSEPRRPHTAKPGAEGNALYRRNSVTNGRSPAFHTAENGIP